MEGLTWRELRRSDAPAILDLELAAEVAEPSERATDLVEVQEQMDRPGLRLAEGSFAVIDDARLVGFGSLIVNDPLDTWAGLLHAVVLPEFRHRGIGRELLQRLLDRARTIHATEHPELPGEVRVWLSQGRDSAATFAERAGFMRVDLSAATMAKPAAVSAVDVRPWTPADDEGTRLAYNASFADHWGSTPASPQRWRNLFADSSSFRPDFSRLAVQDGEVVGFVLSGEFDSETKARGVRTGYVDLVGTVRSVRGRGVASALMAHCLLAMRQSGCAHAELVVDAESPTGAGRLYERLGFAMHRSNEVWAVEI